MTVVTQVHDEPVTDGGPLRVAVVGAGPAGLYATEALLAAEEVDVRVDLLDRLPTPHGLVRYGVAPDHLHTRRAADRLEPVLDDPRVRFRGGVRLGVDVSRDELLTGYSAVLYATGSSAARRLGVTGEDLRRSVAATDLVAWYSADPDVPVAPLDLTGVRRVAVVGVGNVALDVARLLLRGRDALSATDVPEHVLDALGGPAERGASDVEEVVVLGRRGPQHATFTPPELPELGEMDGVAARLRPPEVPEAPDDDSPRAARANLKILRTWPSDEPAPDARRLLLRFWTRPVEVLDDGSGGVGGLRVEGTVVGDDGRLRGDGHVEDLDVQAVVRSVGYRGVALPGVPFDDDAGVVPNDQGRVVDADGTPHRGEYVAGWAGRGPTGVIGTNRGHARTAVAALVGDAAAGLLEPAAGPDVDALLEGRGVRPVDAAGWRRIDVAEQAAGAPNGRGRVKVHDAAELRRVAG